MTSNHLNNQPDPVLADIIRRLVAEFQPTRIYLFGSRARGENGPGSDYDILVVLATATEPGYRLAQRAHRRALRGVPAPVDVILITEREFEEQKAIIGSLPEEATHMGRTLYAA